MLTTLDTTLVKADYTLSDRKFYFIFEGTPSSYYLRSGLSFSMESALDCHEIGIINKLSGLSEMQWQSQIVNRPFRLVVDINHKRNKFEVAIKAVGHETKDQFLVIDTGKDLMSYQAAMELITKQNEN